MLCLGHRPHLEFFHCAGHFANLVLTAEPRQHNIEISAGEFSHRCAHADHRTGYSLTQHHGEQGAEDETADAENRHESSGGACSRGGFRRKLLLLDEQAFLDGLCFLHDCRSRIVHSGGKPFDRRCVLHEFGERNLIGTELIDNFRHLRFHLVVRNQQRPEAVFENLRPRICAAGDRFVRPGDIVADVGRDGGRLYRHFLDAGVHRRLVGHDRGVGKIIELVAKEVPHPEQLVRCDGGVIGLDLDDLREELGEFAELLGKLLDIRPVASARNTHRAFDGGSKFAFGGTRRSQIGLRAGRYIITCEELIAGQFAIDITRAVGFGDDVMIRIDAG